MGVYILLALLTSTFFATATVLDPRAAPPIRIRSRRHPAPSQKAAALTDTSNHGDEP